MRRPETMKNRGGFTLLEIMLAAVVASIIMIAIYGVFSSAVKMRDNATERTRVTQLRTRATNVIRNDLQNALVSGGILAATLQGDSNGSEAGTSFPGYLRLTTTGGKDTISGTSTAGSAGTGSQMYGDVQEVEYYIVPSTNGGGVADGGDLVRVVTRDLMNSTSGGGSSTGGMQSGSGGGALQQQIMTGVQSFQVAFYDGATWQPSWQISGSNSASNSASGTSSATTTSGSSATSSGSNSTTLPQAVRIDIQQVTPAGANQAPPPVEVLVQWTTVPFLSGTNYAVGSGSGGVAQ